jgi:hypothetical protein
LLMATSVIASSGIAATHATSSTVSIGKADDQGPDLAGSHPTCQHRAEHGHDFVSILQNGNWERGHFPVTYIDRSSQFHMLPAVNPADPPPRA